MLQIEAPLGGSRLKLVVEQKLLDCLVPNEERRVANKPPASTFISCGFLSPANSE